MSTIPAAPCRPSSPPWTARRRRSRRARGTDAHAEPPVARAVPRASTIHGETRIDEYFWLRNREDPEVLAYLEAENAYTDGGDAADRARCRSGSSRRCAARIKETDLSVPERIDGWLYYHRTEAGRAVSRSTAAGPTVTDEAARGGAPRPQPARRAGTTTSGWARFEVSPDHRLLAYSVDTSGAEAFTLYVKELATGALLAETIGNVSPSVAWANDSRTLFYVVLDEARRPCRLLPPPAGRQPRRRRAGALRGRRVVLPRHRPHPEPARSCCSTSPATRTSEVRLRQRRPAGRAVPGDRAAPRRRRVHGDPPRRPVLHHHQRRRAQLPPGRARRWPIPRASAGPRCSPTGPT